MQNEHPPKPINTANLVPPRPAQPAQAPEAPAPHNPAQPTDQPTDQQCDPKELFDEMVLKIATYAVVAEETLVAAVLWSLMTHFIGLIQVCPIGLINAPEKACGKSLLLTLLGLLVRNPLSVANSSAAFIFRVIEIEEPTLLIDEADTFLKENGELKGIINAGHTRDQAYVGRTVPDGQGNFMPVRFSVWGAKAIAGIAMERHLPSATYSRCIVMRTDRKSKDEKVERLRQSDHASFKALQEKIALFASQNQEAVRNARPSLSISVQ